MIYTLLIALLVISYACILLFFVYTVYAILHGAPFVPTKNGSVSTMLRLAKLHTNDVLMDLGSGDGRILRKSAKYVKRAIGIEINPLLFWWSKMRLANYKNIEIRRENLWNVDLSNVDVLTIFFIAHHMNALEKKIKKEMSPGSRIISYGFRFPDWQHIEKDGKVYLYIV